MPESAEIFCDSECSPPFNTPSRSAPRNRALSNFVVSSFLGDGNKWVKLQDKSQLIGFVSLKFQTAGVMGFQIWSRFVDFVDSSRDIVPLLGLRPFHASEGSAHSQYQ